MINICLLITFEWRKIESRIDIFNIIIKYKMPWDKCACKCQTACMGNIKESNECTLGALLKQLEAIKNLFEDMKCQSIKLERALMCLRAQVDTEGSDTDGDGNVIAYCDSVAEYDTLITQFLNELNVLLAYKIPSSSGLAVNIIKPWSATAKTYTFPIHYKMECYNWIYFANSAIVDNMSVTIPADVPCVESDVVATISIGCCSGLEIPYVQSIASIVGVLDPASLALFANFQTLLATTMPDKLHRLNSFFDKNIAVIKSAMSWIEELIKTYDLV